MLGATHFPHRKPLSLFRSPFPIGQWGRATAAAAFLCGALMLSAGAGETQPLIIAHRGASMAAPENTVASIRAAARAGADGVEWDTRTTADGHLILQHDDTLKRFIGKKVKVADLTFRQARAYDVGAWFDKNFAGEKMPTLREAIAAALPDVTPLIERKTGSAEQHLAVIRKMGVVDRVVVIAFDWDFLARLRQLEPKLKLGALGSKSFKPEHLAEILKLKPEYVAWKARDLRKDDVWKLHGRGLKVLVWTVDAPKDVRKFVSWGVNGIITNDPARTRSAVKAMGHALPTRSKVMMHSR